MNIIRSLIYKDIRRFWPFLIGMTVLLFMYFSFYQDPLFGDYHIRRMFIIMQVLTISAWSAWVGVSLYIIFDDPPSGSSEFWMTRPISGTQLFVAKYATIGLFCVLLPVLLLSTAKILGFVQNDWFQDAQINSKDYMAIVSRFPILIGGVLGLGLLAVMSRSWRQFSYLFVGLMVTFVLYVSILVSDTSYSAERIVIQHRDIHDWTLYAIFIVAASFIIHNQ